MAWKKTYKISVIPVSSQWFPPLMRTRWPSGSVPEASFGCTVGLLSGSPGGQDTSEVPKD